MVYLSVCWCSHQLVCAGIVRLARCRRKWCDGVGEKRKCWGGLGLIPLVRISLTPGNGVIQCEKKENVLGGLGLISLGYRFPREWGGLFWELRGAKSHGSL